MECCNKIAIYGSRGQSEYLQDLPRLFSFLNENGFRVYLHTKFYDYLSQNTVDTCGGVPCDHLPPGVSLVLSLGGDGTFLRAARWIGEKEIPILGINTGHLGFLASCGIDEAEEMIANVCRGEINIEKRMVLRLECKDFPAERWPYALNEIALMRHGSSMLNVYAKVDEWFLADYRGDGLIVSTPTGSTAYSLSAGGPIIAPTIDCMCLTPVAPHTLNLRPLVVGASSVVTLCPESRSANLILTLDDQSIVLPSESEIKISRAPFSVLLIRKKTEGFPSILRQKLLWSATP